MWVVNLLELVGEGKYTQKYEWRGMVVGSKAVEEIISKLRGYESV